MVRSKWSTRCRDEQVLIALEVEEGDDRAAGDRALGHPGSASRRSIRPAMSVGIFGRATATRTRGSRMATGSRSTGRCWRTRRR